MYFNKLNPEEENKLSKTTISLKGVSQPKIKSQQTNKVLEINVSINDFVSEKVII
ncbi:hypothetical protein J6TS1_20060 [Siminovitchia terrae]|uniref:Uncharacterized protein n=1 Tax=Siminovitchia terrae TaxID=1914933 RepID=A0ABQ4KVS6_SIMTE|nr:hypothetical protein J6TS1_20060 [Siminovitchia terrae]